MNKNYSTLLKVHSLIALLVLCFSLQTQAQESTAISNGALKVTGGNYVSFISIGEIGSDHIYGGNYVATSGIILNEGLLPEPKFPVTGNVYLDDLSPVFVGRATIFKEGNNGAMVEYQDYTITPQGYFQFFVPEGNYTIRIIADNTQYPSAFVTYLGGEILPDQAETIMVSGDSFNNNIILQLEPEVKAEEPTETVDVSGYLVETDEPAPEAALRITKAATITASDEPLKNTYVYLIDKLTGEIFYYTKTDDNGYFEFENIQYRSYYFSVDYPGIPADSEPVELDLTSEATSEVSITAKLSAEGFDTQVDVTTKTEDINETLQTFGIYPNPAVDHITILLDLNDASAIESSWLLLDTGGKVQQTGMVLGERTPISLSNLPAGVYILIVQHKDGTKHKRKFIIK